MKNNLIFILCTFLFLSQSCKSQNKTPEIPISQAEVTRIIKTLASDDMRGRNSLVTEDINKSAQFISYEFEKYGLAHFKDNNYFQNFQAEHKGKSYPFFNVIGVLPGKSLKDEYVIFSAHYDHLGLANKTKSGQDSIYNGADDDASGVTAVIALAKYFAEKKDNERTLIFVAFTAEELGGYGSQYFSSQLNPNKIVAMFNIEMIGKESKFGKNNAFITGYERSDFGKILQQNLKGSNFKFYPDPYPKQNLFYRSDNATLAAYGVPAHTISSDQIDTDKLYHSIDDEVESLDMSNITEIIKAIAISSTSIVSGVDTPTRVEKVK